VTRNESIKKGKGYTLGVEKIFGPAMFHLPTAPSRKRRSHGKERIKHMALEHALRNRQEAV